MLGLFTCICYSLEVSIKISECENELPKRSKVHKCLNHLPGALEGTLGRILGGLLNHPLPRRGLWRSGEVSKNETILSLDRMTSVFLWSFRAVTTKGL